jgi:hypothetical protein
MTKNGKFITIADLQAERISVTLPRSDWTSIMTALTNDADTAHQEGYAEASAKVVATMKALSTQISDNAIAEAERERERLQTALEVALEQAGNALRRKQWHIERDAAKWKALQEWAERHGHWETVASVMANADLPLDSDEDRLTNWDALMTRTKWERDDATSRAERAERPASGSSRRRWRPSPPSPPRWRARTPCARRPSAPCAVSRRMGVRHERGPLLAAAQARGRAP